MDIGKKYVDNAISAFNKLNDVSDKQISDFFTFFAENLSDKKMQKFLFAANKKDIKIAESKYRSTNRLTLNEKSLKLMIDGIKYWQKEKSTRGKVLKKIKNKGFTIEEVLSPLGVILFIFEGRPNVFADGCGVLKSGNTCILRIGSDAINTAKAIMHKALIPALKKSKLPENAVNLIETTDHELTYELLKDSRISLAVIRGSGETVKKLGDIARQNGIQVSLHGTGGAWIFVDKEADLKNLGNYIYNSLDRKVCNTLNTLCIDKNIAAKTMPIILEAIYKRSKESTIHATTEASKFLDKKIKYTKIEIKDLGKEWEWDLSPEISIHVIGNIDDGIGLFNKLSPLFAASLISENRDKQEDFFNKINSPFVGDGITRWVDGQYALNTPELGLSNWEYGRILGRSGILSGASMFTVRLRMRQSKSDLHR